MDYDYQKGFEEGYRMIMGASALLPLAPIQPLRLEALHLERD